MYAIENWIRAHATFAKSSRSEGGNCVEVARSEVVGVRNSKDPDGPVLLFTRSGWERFVREPLRHSHRRRV
jgi:hypothetical protein